MSVSRQGITLCVEGKNRRGHVFYRNDGLVSPDSYWVDENGTKNVLLGLNWFDGECAAAPAAAPNIVYNDYICDNGFTRPYKRLEDNNGSVLNEQYRNSVGSWITLPATLPVTMKFGECPYQKHVVPLAGVALVSGSNTITHNLNLANPNVAFIAYNAATGEVVELKRGLTFTANTFQVITTLPITVDIMVIGEG